MKNNKTVWTNNGYISFYDMTPFEEVLLMLRNNDTGEISEGVLKDSELYDDMNIRLSGSRYSWKYHIDVKIGCFTNTNNTKLTFFIIENDEDIANLKALDVGRIVSISAWLRCIDRGETVLTNLNALQYFSWQTESDNLKHPGNLVRVWDNYSLDEDQKEKESETG